jgi:hypothetical protein
LEDRRISAKSIAEQMGISLERVGFIIHEDLDLLVACFLPGRAKDLSAFMIMSRSFFSEREICQTKVVGKIETHILLAIIFFFPKIVPSVR